MTDTTAAVAPVDIPLPRMLGVAAVLGALGAAVALAFVALMAAGENVLWPDAIDPSAFSGTIRIPIIMTAGGLLVGIIHRLIPSADEENVFVALATGNINAKAIPGGVLIALITLITGFSLGPEVPTGMAAAGVAAFVSARGWLRPNEADLAMGASISSAWGGLFTAPFTAVLINVELSVDRTTLRWARLAADATAALVGFALFFLIDAGWSDVLRLLDLPAFEFEIWNLFLGAGLGVVGAVIGTLFKLSMVATRRLAAPLADFPLIRCTLFGLVFGLVGMALPLTLFLGTQGLADVADEPATLGAGLILVSVAVKLIATTGALSFGFVGGPVFPLLFIGGGLGAVLHLAVDDVPLALAVTAMMAAVPAAVIPVPLGLAMFVVLLSGIGATESTPIFVAAVISMMASKAIEAKLPKPPPASSPPTGDG